MLVKQYKRWIDGPVIILILLFFVISGISFAQSSTNYQLQKLVKVQNDVPSRSIHHNAIYTLGQSLSVDMASSANYTISSGYATGGLNVTDVLNNGEERIPLEFKLCQNYPNPFNPETTIEYHLPQTSEVVLTVFNVQGCQVRRLVHGVKAAGFHTARWDAKNELGQSVASGVYIYRIEAHSKADRPGSLTEIKKMTLIR